MAAALGAVGGFGDPPKVVASRVAPFAVDRDAIYFQPLDALEIRDGSAEDCPGTTSTFAKPAARRPPTRCSSTRPTSIRRRAGAIVRYDRTR